MINVYERDLYLIKDQQKQMIICLDTPLINVSEHIIILLFPMVKGKRRGLGGEFRVDSIVTLNRVKNGLKRQFSVFQSRNGMCSSSRKKTDVGIKM